MDRLLNHRNQIELCELTLPSLRTALYTAIGTLAFSLPGCADTSANAVQDKEIHPKLSRPVVSAKIAPNSLREKMEKLPHVTPAAAIDQFLYFEGQEIAIDCKPVFKSDQSIHEKKAIIEPIQSGDTVVDLPRDVYAKNVSLQYEVQAQGSINQDTLTIISKHNLGKNTVKISGYLMEQDGDIVFHCLKSLKETD